MAILAYFRTLATDERGATAIEYGLIAALIVIAIIGAISQMGGGSGGMWNMLETTAQNHMG